MHLTLPFRPKHDILCPLCCRPIPEYALHFHDGVGFCRPCLAPDSPLPVPDAVQAVRYYMHRADVYSSHGLTVWAPRHKPPYPPAMMVDLGTIEFLATSDQTLPEHPLPPPSLEQHAHA